MIQTTRKAVNYSDNIIDPYLAFNNAGSWTVPSGTGSAIHSEDFVFEGERALKIQNTDLANPITVSNSIQDTIISLKAGRCLLSFYMYRLSATDDYTGNVKIFVNGILIDTQAWALPTTENQEWHRFVSDIPYVLFLGDVVTFTFTFDATNGVGASETVFIDGMMLHDTNRLDGDGAVASYNKPQGNLFNIYTGWGNYADTLYTEGAPLTLVDGVEISLPNDALNSYELQKPLDVNTFYDGTVITGRDGDGVNITIELHCKPLGVGADPRLKTSIDIGGAVGKIYESEFSLSKGSGVEHFLLKSFDAYTLGTWEANGGTVKILATNEDIAVYDIRYIITRTHKAR